MWHHSPGILVEVSGFCLWYRRAPREQEVPDGGHERPQRGQRQKLEERVEDVEGLVEVRAAGEQLLEDAQHALQVAALHHLARRPRQVRLSATRSGWDFVVCLVGSMTAICSDRRCFAGDKSM